MVTVMKLTWSTEYTAYSDYYTIIHLHIGGAIEMTLEGSKGSDLTTAQNASTNSTSIISKEAMGCVALMGNTFCMVCTLAWIMRFLEA